MAYRINAGRVDRDHWMNDPDRGGGRLKGEGCHFIDFLCDQAHGDPVSVSASGFPSQEDLPLACTDNFSLEIRFGDGTVGTIHYAADAPSRPGKERFDLSAPGDIRGDRRLQARVGVEGPPPATIGGRRQDKGFAAQFQHLAGVLKGVHEPPDPETYYLTTITTLAAARSLETGRHEPVLEVAS